MLTGLTKKSKEFFDKKGVKADDVLVENTYSEFGLYSVYDVTSGLFDNPFTSKNNRTAMRMFELMCQRQDTLLAKKPSDFKLFRVATFCADTGTVFAEPNCNNPIFVCNAIDFTPSASVELPPFVEQAN